MLQASAKEIFLEKKPGYNRSFLLSQLSNIASQSFLLICSNIQEAQSIMDDLGFFLGESFKKRIHFFSDWETLPYDTFSPHEDIISDRIKHLATMLKNEKGIYLVTAETVIQKLAPKEHLETGIFLLNVGDTFDLNSSRQRLIELGYQCVNEVIRHGEFAIRGAIIDIFPSNSDIPYRIDLFDNEVDSIRTFSIDNQRSIEKINKIELLPAKEFSLHDKNIAEFNKQWKNIFASDPNHCSFYENILLGKPFGGIEYYIPLFYEKMSSLFDYLHDDFSIIYSHDLHLDFDTIWKNIYLRYEQKSHDITQPILPPKKLWLTAEEFFLELKKFTRYRLPKEIKTSEINININPFSLPQGYRLLIAADSLGRKEIIKRNSEKEGRQLKEVHSWQEFLKIDNPYCIVVAPLSSSLDLKEEKIYIISENDLYGKKVRPYQKKRNHEYEEKRVIYQDISELNIGDPVVHLEHGIGRYLGLELLTIGSQSNEFLTIEYQNENKLFVPVSHLHLISRYSAGDIQHAPLHTLGSDQWEKARKKALEKAYDVAAELLNIYAQRETAFHEGMYFDKKEYEKFCVDFPFEETPDQAEAIRATLEDLQSKRPMDRVICGDVGFGKTEVAMRAAFLTAMNHQQVAILVPTTLLAEQHGENFINRFANWPIKIAVLSRFKTKAEEKEIINQLESGKIDIVIGTHKLLQENIVFHQLGLLIIDEEHRFGVRQKEKFKKFKAKVNILTMTATPIPRTLNMAMANLRDFSIIATPPAKRLSIKTFLFERNKDKIIEAIERELHRGGQVFFLHNNVSTIEHACEELRNTLPEARIRFAHGQMSERELETIMIDFYHQRFNVLVCTTIIETGIDIPTANTIIIDRADKLGLAQLHQLRGRVGRSHHQAYAYLLHPEKESLSSDAKKRLDAIASLGDLGAGFQLASHDLEIRGAGELLGEEQSGQMQAIGFSLYLELIEKAVKTLKSGDSPNYHLDFGKENSIDLGLTALIPEDYMPDIHYRLKFYKRIADVKNIRELELVQIEMIDRFGLLPDAVKNLIASSELKFICHSLGIKKITANKMFLKIEFSEKTLIEPIKLIKLIQSYPNTYQLLGANGFKAHLFEHNESERIQKVHEILNKLRT